jgi:hypothetical protein
MKKILVASMLAALSMSVYGQGLVSILESTLTISTNATAITGGTSGKLNSTANSYYFELLEISDPSGSTTLPSNLSWNGTQVTGLGSWSDSSVSGTNATGINGGKISAISAVPGTAASGWAGGSTNFFIVVGWSANEGSSWSTVATEATSGNWTTLGANSAFGWSLVGYGPSATSPNPGFSVFGTATPGAINTPFTLTAIAAPIPEPGTMALAALGGASLLMFRRKK